MEQVYSLLLCNRVGTEDADKDVVLCSLVMILVAELPRPGGGVILFFHFCERMVLGLFCRIDSCAHKSKTNFRCYFFYVRLLSKTKHRDSFLNHGAKVVVLWNSYEDICPFYLSFLSFFYFGFFCWRFFALL